jgi:hypothetical protein
MTTPQVPGYAVAPEIEGVQTFRTPNGFVAKCRCGWRSPVHASPDVTEVERAEHEETCPWLMALPA